MQVTKGTWRMCEECVPGSLSSSHAQEPGKEASNILVMLCLLHEAKKLNETLGG